MPPADACPVPGPPPPVAMPVGPVPGPPPPPPVEEPVEEEMRPAGAVPQLAPWQYHAPEAMDQGVQPPAQPVAPEQLHPVGPAQFLEPGPVPMTRLAGHPEQLVMCQ